jgi:RimJ/RimL family protein N-acetyltransferase
MRTAEFRVFLGNKTFWNRGIGTESTKLMVVYGFEKMNLNRIWLGVNTENIGGVHAYEKAGFAKEGILRQEQYRNFRYYDVIRMSILRCEYEKIREGYIQVEHNGS